MDLISVIIPVYNTAEYLPRCLDSVLNNTYGNLEVICINDGSTDNSAEILQRYAQQDSRIVVITQENAGVSAARNAGLDRATGEFVAFIDSDDWVHVRYFEVLVRGALENNADIAICGNVQVDHWTADADISHEKIVFRSYAISSYPTIKGSIEKYIWARIYKRALIGDHRFAVEIKFAEDNLFNLDLVYSEVNIACVVCEKPLYFYFVRWGSLTHTKGTYDLQPLIVWYLNHALHLAASGSNAEQYEDTYIVEALKMLYSWRYGAILSKNRDELQEIKGLLRTAMNLLQQSSSIPLRSKVLYSALTIFPFLYRWFRTITDPTMRDYEKRLKAEQNKCNSN